MGITILLGAFVNAYHTTLSYSSSMPYSLVVCILYELGVLLEY